METNIFYNCVFLNQLGEKLLITVKWNCSFKELIHLYFKKKGKENVFINNFENTYFTYNAKIINYTKDEREVFKLFETNLAPIILVNRLDYNKSLKNIEKIETIKDNLYTCVDKAKYNDIIVAVKKIKKSILKEDIKEERCIDIITEEEFKGDIIKFNRELSIMKQCYCENSVEIYDYFDTEEYFIIVMELCDNTLFKELAKTKKGFEPKEIREILLQLNNVFRIMNERNIVHRDIKLHNILVKYLNEEKSKFKVLLSDYGVSNQLSSMTKKYKTHAGTQIIMAPEILSLKKYDNKCDLWSLGVIIYQLYTKKPPYTGRFDNEILQRIDKLGQSVLDVIKDIKLKDLLSKLLVKDPNKRISWDEYFEHQFFK